jgi:hypothetical protein
MTDEPTEPIPPRPPPLPPPLHPTTKIPRVYRLPGTVVFAGCSVVAFFFMIALGFGLDPPWYVILPSLFYVFVSSGIIAIGRIEANKDAKFFIETIKRQSEEIQKHAMRKMN